MNDIQSAFMRCIHAGNYLGAKAASFDQLSEEEFYDLIIGLGFEVPSVSLYTFVCFLLQSQESAYLHQVASVLISQALSHIEGSCSSGLFHARRAAFLNSNNMQHKEYLLLFYNMPDKLMSDLEAKTIAQEILKIDPLNQTALRTLEDIKRFQVKK